MTEQNCAKINSRYVALLGLRAKFFALAEGGWTKGNTTEGKMQEKKIREAMVGLDESLSVDFLGQQMRFYEKKALIDIMISERSKSAQLDDFFMEATQADDELKLQTEERFKARIGCEGGKLIKLDLSSSMNSQSYPYAIGKLKNLEDLNLHSNDWDYDEKVFAQLASLPKLKYLNIGRRTLRTSARDLRAFKKAKPWFDDLRARLGNNFLY